MGYPDFIGECCCLPSGRGFQHPTPIKFGEIVPTENEDFLFWKKSTRTWIFDQKLALTTKIRKFRLPCVVHHGTLFFRDVLRGKIAVNFEFSNGVVRGIVINGLFRAEANETNLKSLGLILVARSNTFWATTTFVQETFFSIFFLQLLKNWLAVLVWMPLPCDSCIY